jgi:hypothetical protein
MVQFTTAAASLYCICKKSEGGKIRKHNKIKKGRFQYHRGWRNHNNGDGGGGGMPEMLLFGLVE